MEKEYRKAGENLEKQISGEHKEILTELEIADRVEITNKAEAYITVKDHKDAFPNKVSTRLINPCKPELGKVSNYLII